MYSTETRAELLTRIDIKEVFDLYFSPKGTYLCLWCKPVLLNKELGIWTNNLKIYNLKTLSLIAEWPQKNQGGWQPQFSSDEKIFAIGAANNKEIHFFDINPLLATVLNIHHPTFKYKVSDAKVPFQNFAVSPGLNSAVAVFFPEKSGKPLQVLVYSIPNFNQPVCLKTFFKAEKCQFKWNSLGTALLALALTDHDSTNQSYYGETNLYLLGIAGSYNSRIELSREGPIHDITWSPSAREFAVNYGYMPSETTFFDARGHAIHSLPTAPRNTILYSPHARYVLVAGFGNLQGTVDVYDRQNKFSKVVTFEASNTSVCEWSPCGRFILTATTSPRLRVDNGCKIWHASGKLIYYKEFAELFSIAWKPQSIGNFPHLKLLEAAPEPHESAVQYLATKKAAAAALALAKPRGAYRPPHARGSPAASSGSSLQEMFESKMKVVPGAAKVGVNSVTSRARVVPGAAPPVEKESKSAAKNRKKREAKRQAQEDGVQPAAEPQAASLAAAPLGGVVEGGVFSIEEKKIRSLLKKLRAIEQLKLKQAAGDPLEDTQVSKIKKEDDIRQELTALGWSE